MDVLITLSFFHPQNKRNFKNHPSLFSATEERERSIASEREQLQADIERLTAEIEREAAARRSEREAFVNDIDAQVEEKKIKREEDEVKESTWAVRREEAFRQDNELASKLAKWNLKPEAEVLTVSVSLKMLKHSFVFLFAQSQCFSLSNQSIILEAGFFCVSIFSTPVIVYWMRVSLFPFMRHHIFDSRTFGGARRSGSERKKTIACA